MTEELSQRARLVASPTPLEMVTPPSARMLFWRARYLRASPLLHHLPFLFWLIEAQRPASLVEIGVGEGVAYMAACQAIDKLDLTARCYGIVTDPAAEAAALRRLHDEQYADFSRLLDEPPAQAANRFPQGGIDLLMLTGAADAARLEELRADWLPRLSPRGVILLHGLYGAWAAEPGRAFVEEIAAGRPVIVLEAGEGLLVVLWGEERNDRLQRLAGLGFGDPGHAEVHRIFSRLGAATGFEWDSRQSAGALAEARRGRKAAEQAAEAGAAEAAAAVVEQARLAETLEMRNAQLAEALARLRRLETAAEAQAAAEAAAPPPKADPALAAESDAALVAERDAALAQLEHLAGQLDDSYRAAAEAAAREADLAGRLEAAEAGLRARFDEIAALTARLEAQRQAPPPAAAAGDGEAERARLKQQVEEITGEAAMQSARNGALTARLEKQMAAVAMLKERQAAARAHWEAERAGLKARIEQLEAHHQSMLNSTSWRLTAPVRKLGGIARPKRG